jgi:hypothetical protein
MANQSKNFISFVALGGLNPQILNIDFLKVNSIISINDPPFDKLLKQGAAPDTFISVPGLVANLVVANIEIFVDQQRLQIRDTKVSEWSETKILDIASKYFQVLPYTPLKLVGVNFNSTIMFDTSKEAQDFQELFFPRNSPLAQIISKQGINASSMLRYPYSDSGNHSRIQLTIEQPDTENKRRVVNINYEFDFTGWESFKNELKRVPEIGKYCDHILEQFLKVI